MSESGFNVGTAASSFTGVFFAAMAAFALQPYVMPAAEKPEAVSKEVVEEVVTPAGPELDVAAEGLEERVSIGGVASSRMLSFSDAGLYRIELRALTGAADPLLNLYQPGNPSPFASNDDADGSLDSILEIEVPEGQQSWRLELSSIGGASGPGVLRILPIEGFSSASYGATTSGPSGYGNAAAIDLTVGADAVAAEIDDDGLWFRIVPTSTGVHDISITADNPDFDTRAFLVPLLEGPDSLADGTDITTVSGAFTSDDDDGLNPHFRRFLLKDTAYILYVDPFHDGSSGTMNVSVTTN